MTMTHVKRATNTNRSGTTGVIRDLRINFILKENFISETSDIMTISRRRFLGTSAAISLGFTGLGCSRSSVIATDVDPGIKFGPLQDDPNGIIALPPGFSYKIFSRAGESMSDGLLVPARHDGMAAFPGPDGITILVRNHEIGAGADAELGPFGPDLALLDLIDRDLLYDNGGGNSPALGGTTTILYDTVSQQLVSHHLSLSGTLLNCAGGPTPWGSWISCEEVVSEPENGFTRKHGYNFEISAGQPGLQRAVPLTDMGRFKHEAVAVHPASGIIYETEDLSDGILYRFIPHVPGELSEGGRLQALAVTDRPSLDTRNWETTNVPLNTQLETTWVDLDDVDSPDDDLRYRGFAAGAARFARGEGIFYGEREGKAEVYIACTNGGAARKGQIWTYRPSPFEGTDQEASSPGSLELFVEPNDGTIIENADNLCVAPWGDLIVCEDGSGDDYLLGITPDGEIYKLARDLNGTGEFAGCCFSADGSTLFVNKQIDGWTLAITGPWSSSSESLP